MWEERELQITGKALSQAHHLDDLLADIEPDSIPEMEDWPAVGAEIIDDDYSR